MNKLPGMAYRIVKQDGWKMEFVSQGCQLLTGYDSAYFVNQALSRLFQLIHPDDLNRVEKEFQSAIDRKRSFQAEYRITTAGGGHKWVFNRAEAATFDSGGSIRIEGFITDFTAYKTMEQQLRNENLLLRSTMRDRYKFGNIIGNSKAMQDVYELILKAATTDDSVFILGESGTGKELVSLAIHQAGDRRHRKCVIVNCGAIPENLIESEFFGYVKGAFTGAGSDKKGFLETADGGTLFLDEIGEISLNMQVKLLRAIEGGGFTPIGSQKLLKPNLRIIAASNKDPVVLMKQGKMRSDFFFRIHVIPITLPPLREREDDILLLVDHFLKTFSKTESLSTLSPENLRTLRNYHWPGNVRELQNVIRRYIALRNFDFLSDSVHSESVDQIGNVDHSLTEALLSLQEAVARFEKNYILEALKKNRWQKGKTATILNVSRKTLFRKMKAHEII
jgi:PAS domain S-box-containing protein